MIAEFLRNVRHQGVALRFFRLATLLAILSTRRDSSLMSLTRAARL